MVCEEAGSQPRGVDVVETCLDVQKEGGHFEPWSLEGAHFVDKGGAGVRSAQAWEGAALIWVEEASSPCQGRQPNGHDPFQDLGDSSEEDNDAEGGRGVVRSFAGLVQHHTVGPLEGGRVVAEVHKWG